MNWPDTKDGKLFKRLERQGVNFSKPHYIEFNVDFEHWPPPLTVITQLKSKFGNVNVFEPTYIEEGQEQSLEGLDQSQEGLDQPQEGYIALKTFTKVTYEFVITTQQEITDAMRPYGGYCNTWGILI